jgi:hypothetical protein
VITGLALEKPTGIVRGKPSAPAAGGWDGEGECGGAHERSSQHSIICLLMNHYRPTFQVRDCPGPVYRLLLVKT